MFSSRSEDFISLPQSQRIPTSNPRRYYTTESLSSSTSHATGHSCSHSFPLSDSCVSVFYWFFSRLVHSRSGGLGGPCGHGGRWGGRLQVDLNGRLLCWIRLYTAEVCVAVAHSLEIAGQLLSDEVLKSQVLSLMYRQAHENTLFLSLHTANVLIIVQIVW